MKTLKNIYKTAGLLGLLALGASSCTDWLTVYPTTQIVEENFWEDKNDLEGVRYAAYKNMCGTVDKFACWGDFRSDAYEWNTECSSSSNRTYYKEISEGKLDRDSAYSYFQWGDIYTTINYCNKVLQHGSEVLERDKQFTTSEWLQMKAEMTALRALNYFYLLRSFKDIPYSTQVINKDTEVKYFGATNQLVVLDSLILDVENIQGTARNRFTDTKDTKGLITNAAIYAILSDMYLWRASLHEGRYGKKAMDTVNIKNIVPNTRVRNLTRNGDSLYVAHSVSGDYIIATEYADLALASLAKQNEEENKAFGVSTEEKCNYDLTNCDMYKNSFEGFTRGENPTLTAVTKIFSKGNSQESIFELQYSSSESTNPIVTSLWGSGESVQLCVSKSAIDEVYKNASDHRNRDSRLWFSAWNKVSTEDAPLGGMYCFKWCSPTPVADTDSKKADDMQIKINTSEARYSNWIVYRMADMMLIKAEALAAIGETKEAMRYVNANHRRWYCNDNIQNPLQPNESVAGAEGGTNNLTEAANYVGNAPKAASVEIAVMNERLLEFLGEGKRWFDLVRYAERHAGGKDGTKDEREWTESNPVNSGKVGVDAMVDTFMGTTFSNIVNTLKNRFKNRYGLYNIIHYMEIKASVDKDGVQHLEQNPVWNKSKYD